MFLFDTNALSEITNRRPNGPFLSKFLACAPALRFASEMTRYELNYGCELLPAGNTMWTRIEKEVLRHCTWLPLDATVCMRAATIGARLRRTGQTIDLADLFIAATAATHGLVVVTRNRRHFDRIEGLPVENWIVPSSD